MNDDNFATESDAIREYAANAGSEQHEKSWILTPWDAWVRNPAYTGLEVRHPEEEADDH